MPDLTRSTARTPGHPSGRSGPHPADRGHAGAAAHGGTDAIGGRSGRVLLLRERPRSVRPESDTAVAGVRLAFVVAVAACSVLGLWTLGFLGFRLGAAPAFGVPDLLAEPGQGLATGVAMVMRSPEAIFRAALAQPLWLIAGFIAIAIPASLLPLARPAVRGGPPPSTVLLGLSATGAAVAMIAAAGIATWFVSPLRGAWLATLATAESTSGATAGATSLPSVADTADRWISNLSIVAGVDLMLVIGAVLWMVVVLRLAIAPWLRWLAGTIVAAALAIALVGWSISAATAAHVHGTRMVITTTDGDALLLGSTREHLVLLRRVDGTLRVDLREPTDLSVSGHTTLAEFIAPQSE